MAENAKILIHLIETIFLVLIYAQLGQIKDAFRDAKSRPSGVKTGFLQTMSGKVFTVKNKRKVVYNDDINVAKKEREKAGEIPYSRD